MINNWAAWLLNKFMHTTYKLDMFFRLRAIYQYICCGKHACTFWAPWLCHRTWICPCRCYMSPCPLMCHFWTARLSRGFWQFLLPTIPLWPYHRSPPQVAKATHRTYRQGSYFAHRLLTYFLQELSRAFHPLPTTPHSIVSKTCYPSSFVALSPVLVLVP